jgi:very-short-patch-repair endonuclease
MRPVGPYYVIYGTRHEYEDAYDEDRDPQLESVGVWIIGITTSDKLQEHMNQINSRVYDGTCVQYQKIDEFYEWGHVSDIFRR